MTETHAQAAERLLREARHYRGLAGEDWPPGASPVRDAWRRQAAERIDEAQVHASLAAAEAAAR